MSYTFILILIGLSILGIIDISLGFYDIDRYGLFASIFIYSPIGIILLSLSALVKWKDEYKTVNRKYVLTVGICVGTVLMIMSPLLFIISG